LPEWFGGILGSTVGKPAKSGETADPASVLADVAERAEDIDAARADAAKRRAEDRLSKPTMTDFDAERARIAMLRALTRLQVARHSRTRG
jgi:F0F1-type ATP synthase epsilon subunit